MIKNFTDVNDHSNWLLLLAEETEAFDEDNCIIIVWVS